MTNYDWFLARMTPTRATSVLRWKLLGCNVIWFWKNLTADDDGAPNDPIAAVAAARKFLEAHHA